MLLVGGKVSYSDIFVCSAVARFNVILLQAGDVPSAAAGRPEQGGGEGEGLGVCLQRSRRRRGAGQVHLVSGNYIIASFDSSQGCLIL